MRGFRRCLVLALCLSNAAAWADAPTPDLYVEDPYAPHDTSGSIARLGTMAGFLYGMPQSITELGLVAGAGQRFGRFAIEAEAAYFDLQTVAQYMSPIGVTSGDVGIGRGERVALLARLDVLRFDSHAIGPNSMAAIYVEGGGATEWVQFTAPLDSGIRPDNYKRIEGLVGFGVMLDHRLQGPIGFPHRIAWFLGLRVAMSPHQPLDMTVCRSDTVCAREAMPETNPGPVDQSMIFQSSLAFTF
jgi:hypothetical protein